VTLLPVVVETDDDVGNDNDDDDDDGCVSLVGSVVDCSLVG
jgi:hypothetical protein